MKEHVKVILKERYLTSNENSWEDLVNRVSEVYPDIKQDMMDMNFIFSSPTLMNFGVKDSSNKLSGTLSSCFPMGITDSMEDIMESVKEAALVTKACGGVGYNFSSLRSSKETIKSIDRHSSGPIPFIKIFNSVLDGVQQGFRRRGAGMAQLSIFHPDIISFIETKSDYTNQSFNRFNFSVRIPDEFYDKLNKTPDDVMKVKKVTKDEWIPLEHNGTEYTYKMVWDLIISQAWKSAEPGIFNESIAWNRFSCKNKYDNVLANPCSEHISAPYSSCNLGSINLSNYVEGDDFNYNKLAEIVDKGIRALDAVIDSNYFVIDKIEEVTKDIRPVGLGTMGIHHALIKMGIPYGSKQGRDKVEEVLMFITKKAMETSIELASEKEPYPSFDYNTYVEANKRFLDSNIKSKLKKVGIRNSLLTNIAPTGTLSYIADCSSGIEPVFALSFIRKIEKAKGFEPVCLTDSVFESYINDKYPDQSEEIINYVLDNKGSCQGCDILTKKEQDIFKVSNDISANDHLDMLGIASNSVTSAVSKTINLPKEATKQEVADVYLNAHKKGIIGVTVYREHSREGVLLTEEQKETSIVRKDAPKRPKELECDIHELNVDNEHYIVLIGKLNGKLYELFVTKDNKKQLQLSKHKHGIIVKKSKHVYDLISIEGESIIENIGDHFNDSFSAIARLISAHLRHGTPLKYIVHTINKDTYKRFYGFEKSISRVLKKYINNGENADMPCPECEDGSLIYVEGCISCMKCGYAKCG